MVPPLATQKNERAIKYSRGLTNIPWREDYEKMISGMLYSCTVPELAAARNRARRLAQKFNTWVPPNGFSAEQVTETKVGMINELFGKVGSDIYVEPSLQVDYGCNITIGNTFYANFNTVILD
ncbi:galactoside O-acetyltransferase [Fusarium oxysporum f. sp. phaseoli]